MSVRSIDLRIIVGLGNPGPKYTETRHNAGFWFVEEVARKYGATFRQEKKFHGEIAKVNVQSKDIWLLKPDTFMNRSGLATHSMLSFYRISAEQLLVAHDEIDLPPGTARLKTGGGHGGHNGLRDIINQLGSKDFHRLRIGVGHPGSKDQVVDYVLHNASRDERILIDRDIDDAVSVLPDLADGSLEKAMMTLHSKS
jgi:PTH1 family peptidyl-tRNA hydrolase